MKRRLISDTPDWTIEEKINSTTGNAVRHYYFKRHLAVRIALTSNAARRVSGLNLIEKDLRTIKIWSRMLRKELEHFGATPDSDEVIGFMPQGDEFYVSRALYVSILATYGKMFTQAKGRGISLKRDWVPDSHIETHDTVMKERHTFAAHSGEGSNEMCGIVLAIDYSPKNRTEPRIFSELRQPTVMTLSMLASLDALVDALHERVIDRLERAVEHLYEEVTREFPEDRLRRIRRKAPKKLLRPIGPGDVIGAAPPHGKRAP